MTTKVSMGLAALGLGAAVLTGCGGSDGGSEGGDDGFADQSAEKIADQAKKDMDGLTSAHVAGSLTSDGQEIELDLQVSTEGDCTGSIGIGGGSTELLGVDGTVWMKPDEAFWKLSAGDSADQVIAAVGDKWVSVPSDSEGFNELCDLDDLLEQLVNDDEDETTYTKKGDDELDGEKVLLIESKDDDGPSTGYVLLDSPHYLVKVERTEGDEPGSMTFSDFDEKVDVEAPGDDEVVDLNSLS